METARLARLGVDGVALAIERLARGLRNAAARARQRRALAELDARLLADIGLTPDDVRREAAKPFWRP